MSFHITVHLSLYITVHANSWMHPRSKHWHLIDYVITRAKDNHDVRVTKAMCGADCWTDHRLIISKLKFRIQPPRHPQGKQASKKLNTNKFLLESVSQKLSEDLDSKLTDVTFNHTDINENWSALRDVVYQRNTKTGLMKTMEKSRIS